MENNKDLKRIQELKDLINKYDHQYYELGRSEISDAEYDRLYEEYLSFESKYPELKDLPDAPTKKVGAGSTAGSTTLLPKHTHKSPLLSINKKGKTIEDLYDFYQSIGGDGTEVIIQPKLDGITVNINYENGEFINAATRGNGYIGDLITDNFRNTKTKFPLTLKNSIKTLELRGEAIIGYDFFKKNLLQNYSNPRNAVAGLMRSINPEDVKEKGIQIMFYDIGITDYELSHFDSDDVQFLKEELNFQTIPQIVVDNFEALQAVVFSKMNNYIQEIDGFNVLKYKDYPDAVCDGLVIKANSRNIRNELGMTEKGPRWAYAHKFKSLQATTKIEHIEWNTGKTGKITPTAVFKEISLGGVKITRATLNNIEYMQNLPVFNSEEKGLRQGDNIIVERSNDVIPRIIGIQNRETTMNEFLIPSVCPVCGSPIQKIGPQLFCMNKKDCPAQHLGKFEQFVSRDGMNITGLGTSILEKFISLGFIRTYEDIYHLEKYKEQIIKLDKFGQKKYTNLINSIKSSTSPTLSSFLYALCIPSVGKATAKDLANTFKSLQNFLDGSYEDLLGIQDISDITARYIIDWKNDENNLKGIKGLLESGITVQMVEENTTLNKLTNKTFVITGTLTNPRKYYQELIEQNGGKVTGSVSKKTDYVLLGDNAGSKEEKARKLNVTIINENQFMEMIKE